MAPLALIAALAAAAGLVALRLAWRRARRGRPLAACTHGLGGCCGLAVAAALAGVSLNLLTYARLTHEQAVGAIAFTRVAPETFRASLALPGHTPPRSFVLRGDEWQIDARVLKWHGLANVLGLDAAYRLERLSGRYADTERERAAPRTVFALAEPAGLDLWLLARRHARWVPLVDTVYGSGAYLPMADGAAFQVRLGQAGLIARPLNDAGREAVSGWR